MRITKVCETCGSEAVQIDAVAEWDLDSQSWELQSNYHFIWPSWCRDCDAETYISRSGTTSKTDIIDQEDDISMTHGPRTAAQYTGCAVLGPLAGPGARPGPHNRKRPSRRAAGRAHIVESGRAAGPQGAAI
jgi:hypothetical protein